MMNGYNGKADIIIKNGKVVDGTGNPFYFADIAVEGGRIAYIGDLSGADADLIIDAEGKLVTPGFIDSHSHSDATIWVNPECQSTIRQGVTTEVVGNCGSMMKPPVPKEFWDRGAEGIATVYDDGEVKPGCFRDVLGKAEKMGISENLAWLCGHNDIRKAAGVSGPDYTDEQFETMAAYLREAMDAGYIGFSTGLEFEPGRVAGADEINRLGAIVAEYDGIYASHIRNRDSAIHEAIEEFLDVLRINRIRGTLSHLNVRLNSSAPDNALRRAIARLHEARDNENINVLTDMTPTLFGMGLMSAILPPWVFRDGWDKAKQILNDPGQRQILKTSCDRYWRFIHNGDWFRVRVQNAVKFPEINGTPFTELAKLWGKDEWECFFDILGACDSMAEADRCLMLAQMFAEEDIVDSAVRDPLFMWEVDSFTTSSEEPLASATASPQHYKDITYYFTHHVRDEKNISIEKAVNKITWMPASHYRLDRRGQIAIGYYADINVFSLDDLKINSGPDNPAVYSEGMYYVLVNGVPVIANGEHTKARPGKVIRRTDWGG